MSVSKAIWLGLVVVNGPVMLLLLGPLFLFAIFVEHGIVPREYNWVGLLVFLGGFVFAWLWWSLSVPRWRLWAYQRVADIATLKERAVGVGLTWPDDHIFTRTEIKSRSHTKLERELDTTLDQETDPDHPANTNTPKDDTPH
jgi:hypothetical protein